MQSLWQQQRHENHNSGHSRTYARSVPCVLLACWQLLLGPFEIELLFLFACQHWKEMYEFYKPWPGKNTKELQEINARVFMVTITTYADCGLELASHATIFYTHAHS